ncbi:hypothetical protein ACFQO1_05605 [Jejudonia soesokkakensis]|uniref:LTD domain-containing protein n=1 Tax=Jejudonia soesokkakensis TaxID=1323432 RepID=A0ABW2MQH6_9FLAO
MIRFLMIFFVFLCCFNSKGQVGINTITPSNAAVLEVASSHDGINFGGFMPPKVTLAQRALIPVGVLDDGLLIYLINGTERCIQMYNAGDTVWENVYCQPINERPVASNVTFTGTLVVGQTLTASFTYSDTEGDAEGAHIYTWYAADDAAGTNETQIQSGILNTYTLLPTDDTKFISVEVTPMALTGSLTGFPVQSTYQGPVALTPPPINPWINEIHYDNAGGDANEGVEIAGPSGTDLTGWTIVLYNGANGQTYSTINLSGTISNQQNGSGTINFLETGIQNGDPDGLALVDDLGSVIQFLSYEGVFNATNGPANGMTSTDIGVSEGSGTASQSMQLQGSGNQYSDFTWAADIAETRGLVNTGQTFTP